MTMIDSGDEYISGPSDVEPDLDDEFKHAKLLDAISSLDGKKRTTKFLRKEATQQVSEFNIGSGDVQNKVNVTDLLSKINSKTKTNKKLKEKLKKAVRNTEEKVLATPLPTHQQEQIRRSIAYETVTTEVSKWDSVVQRNRKADQLQFPLGRSALDVINQPSNKFVQRFQAHTPLEKEVAALLGTSDHIIPSERKLSKAEERALKAMSLKEAQMRRAELQKYRALLSYEETKARRQNKIKSKSYHKVLRKEKQKVEENSLEELRNKDPESYNEKMKHIERIRIQERMSLKHKGGSKYSRQQKIHAKYDKEAQQTIQDMHQKHQELTKKIAIESESEEEVEIADDTGNNSSRPNLYNPWIGSSIDVKNPWMNPDKIKKVSEYSRPAEIKNTEIADILHSASEDEQDRGLSADNELPLKNQAGKSMKTPESRPKTDNNEETTDSTKDRIVADKDSSKKGKKRKSVGAEGKSGELEKQTPVKKIKTPRRLKKDKVKGNSAETNRIKKEIRSKLNNTDDIDEMFDVLDDADVQAVELKKQKQDLQGKKNKCFKDKNPNEKKRHTEFLDVDENEESFINESTTQKRTLEDLDMDDWSENEELTISNVAKVLDKETEKPKVDKIVEEKEVKIDPKKVLTMKTDLRGSTAGKFVSDDEDNEEDEDKTQRMTIAEAFADDDILNEFESEKKELENAAKPKDIDLSLPGWGSWVGEGIPISKRKKRRFLIKAPPVAPRKDRNLGNVIISEKKDTTIQKHQVSSLPYPYSNVSQFESTLQAPLGRTWNTASSFKRLTKPKVVTRLGTIIEPMDKSQKHKDSRQNSNDLPPQSAKPQRQTVNTSVKMPLKSKKLRGTR